jgi:uncharacterized membrane protein
MKTTILGGALFLVPLVFVVLILSKAFEISMLLAAPIERLIPLNRVAGVALADLLAILLIIFVCYLAGLAAHFGPIAARVKRVEDLLIDILPGYVIAKGVVGGVTKNDTAKSVLHPVMVSFDDYDQIAFEIERFDNKAVVFLPGAPSAWSGASVVVDLARVKKLDLPPHKVVSLLRVMGRGTSEVKLPLESAG